MCTCFHKGPGTGTHIYFCLVSEPFQGITPRSARGHGLGPSSLPTRHATPKHDPLLRLAMYSRPRAQTRCVGVTTLISGQGGCADAFLPLPNTNPRNDPTPPDAPSAIPKTYRLFVVIQSQVESMLQTTNLLTSKHSLRWLVAGHYLWSHNTTFTSLYIFLCPSFVCFLCL